MRYLNLESIRDVAVIRFNDPEEKVNTLKAQMMEELQTLLDQIQTGYRAAVLISSKPDGFIAGADIEMFKSLTEPGQARELSQQGHQLFDQLASLPFPTVAAINGAALGGGCEVALACKYRIATDDPKTMFGLPEVKLGLLPGLGGTQRLPPLVGLQNALDMLLTGKNIYGHKARKLGLVDETIHKHALLDASITFALRMADRPKKKHRNRTLLTRFIESPFGRPIAYKTARKTINKQTAGNYPAPFKILECVEAGLSNPKRGPQVESENFDQLVRSPESRALTNLFFNITASKKNPLADQAQDIKTLGVLGAGLMGAGVAEVSLPKDIRVIMKDIKDENLAKGEQSITSALQKKVKRRIISSFEKDRILGQLHSTTDYQNMSKADIVIEAVFEDLALKKKMVADVEQHCSERCIFASNTSSLAISSIAEDAKRPQNIIGMHYFSPVPKMPLLEIIVTPQTADWVTATAVQLGIAQGKNVIVVNDGPGFYTTRILGPLLNEAVVLLEEGADARQIDKAMFQWGFPVGPITLLDEVGLDVGAHVGGILQDMFTQRTGQKPTQSIKTLYEAGFHGRKNRKGFYQYDPDGKKSNQSINPEIYQYFGGPNRKAIPFDQITERLALIMINEAAWCLQENILRSAADGDLGAIMGLGFPPFRGGPFYYMDQQGVTKIHDRLKALEDRHGPRFSAAPIITSTQHFHKI